MIVLTPYEAFVIVLAACSAFSICVTSLAGRVH